MHDMRRPPLTVTLIFLIAAGSAAANDQVNFDQHIRPLLSDTCFQCHGPDAETRKANLRLDLRDSVFDHSSEPRRVVPGDAAASEIYRRLTAEDPDVRMPPADSGRQLSPQQIEQVRQWINQGAAWQDHWSFLPVVRPPLPDVGNTDWVRNPIDVFVLQRLRDEGMSPSPEADRPTLLRRVTLDLTGLPPTLEQIEAFERDESADAWETVVDQLLQSTSYGERMAVRWLDLARYADTSGYQSDGPRHMWRWRDWVIDAYNNNMPFSQFTIEQLAGDLLQSVPDAGRTGLGGLDVDQNTLNRWIASGFNRNHRGNSEGGVDPEEYQVEYVVDRVDTTATVWLGLTMGCARCHDHKYDPISQREFYEFFACFNNIPENGRALKEGNSPPYIKAPTPGQYAQLQDLRREISELEQRWQKDKAARVDAQSRWETALKSQTSSDWQPSLGLTAHFALDGDRENSVATASDDESDATAASPGFGTGKTSQSLHLDTSQSVPLGNVGAFDYRDDFTLSAWVYAEGDGTVLARKNPGAEGRGYSFSIRDGHLYLALVNRWLDDCIRISTAESVSLHDWHHVAITYDGSRQAAGVVMYLDGQPCTPKVDFDFLNQSIASEEPFRIGGGLSALKGRVDEVRLYSRALNSEEVLVLSTIETLDELVAVPQKERTIAEENKLLAAFLAVGAPQSVREQHSTLQQKRRELDTFVAELPTTMVMHESHPRDTRLLRRGQFDQPSGDRIMAAAPSALSENDTAFPEGRLSLARWLFSGRHPLTARVAVNRYWQTYFGEGLVRTLEDFGSQGQRPTHPELLDWLAAEFVAGNWNIKAMQKLIVMSATYRQTSRATAELREKDPENRLLGRGPRFRLTAEVVRDQALTAAGLLYRKVGGPSVKTYQPEGLWSEFSSDKNYEQASGADLYRRSLYTYWKRTVGPPTMLTFDATTREMCTVRRARTNTPLQALALMNDVTFVEAARALAERMILEGGSSADGRITLGFRLVLSRRPTGQELQLLQQSVPSYTEHFSDETAEQLVTIGDAATSDQIDKTELAAWTLAASVILNLDETVTRR